MAWSKLSAVRVGGERRVPEISSCHSARVEGGLYLGLYVRGVSDADVFTVDQSMTAAVTIDEVIDRLDGIIAQAREENSRVGYFPALYRKVTLEVKRGIADGAFDDGPRMERLDVVFANRYLDAYDAYRRGEPTTLSWKLALDTTSHRWPIVLQHLLLGINAHINLDLGIAAAQTSPGASLPSLEEDFIGINGILAAMVDGVQDELGQVWPLMRVLDWVGGRTDEHVVHFSMEKARAAAWGVANELANLDATAQATRIVTIDRDVEGLGRRVRYPGPLLSTVSKLIRLAELRSVRRVINILA